MRFHESVAHPSLGSWKGEEAADDSPLAMATGRCFILTEQETKKGWTVCFLSTRQSDIALGGWRSSEAPPDPLRPRLYTTSAHLH